MKMYVDCDYRNKTEEDCKAINEICNFLIKAFDEGEALAVFALEADDKIDYSTLRKRVDSATWKAERLIYKTLGLRRGEHIFYPKKVNAKAVIQVKIIRNKLLEATKNGKC